MGTLNNDLAGVLSMSFQAGDIVEYGERFGVIIRAWVKTTWIQGPLYQVYFFDEDKDVLLDGCVLKLSEDKTWYDFHYYFIEKCTCGEKHVAEPKAHSSWCKIETMRKEIISDKDKSSSKLAME
jgi:hypothetical protein